jgi:hypothetical protein
MKEQGSMIERIEIVIVTGFSVKEEGGDESEEITASMAETGLITCIQPHFSIPVSIPLVASGRITIMRQLHFSRNSNSVTACFPMVNHKILDSPSRKDRSPLYLSIHPPQSIYV